MPLQYRETGEYATRESAAIKPIFKVAELPSSDFLDSLVARTIKEFAQGDREFIDLIDPEGNVIQLAN